MGDNIGSPLKWTTIHGCGKRIINNQGHSVLMGYLGEALDIEDSATGVGNSLTKHSLGVRTESCLNLLVRGFLRDECTIDTQFLQSHAKEVIGATIWCMP